MTDGLTQDAVRIERIIDAPAHLVWKMWTEPEHFAAWYGPAGVTMPIATMDVRVGGARFICMEMATPNGPMQMWFTGEYREVVEDRHLVYTESLSNPSGDIIDPSDIGMPPGHPVTTEVRVELEELDGHTKLIITHVGIPADSPGAVGWALALDKLATHILTQR